MERSGWSSNLTSAVMVITNSYACQHNLEWPSRVIPVTLRYLLLSVGCAYCVSTAALWHDSCYPRNPFCFIFLCICHSRSRNKLLLQDLPFCIVATRLFFRIDTSPPLLDYIQWHSSSPKCLICGTNTLLLSVLKNQVKDGSWGERALRLK